MEKRRTLCIPRLQTTDETYNENSIQIRVLGRWWVINPASSQTEINT